MNHFLNARALGEFLSSVASSFSKLLSKPKQIGLTEEEAIVISRYLPQLVKLRSQVEELRVSRGKVRELLRIGDPANAEQEIFDKLLSELLSE